jgi:6 kDa early secretory antigenic target
MSEQLWNFAQIEAGSSEIQASVGTTAGLLEEGEGSLANLAGVWGGSGSDSYQQVQQNWNNASNELNQALLNLAHKVSEAGSTMAQTEAGVAANFG